MKKSLLSLVALLFLTNFSEAQDAAKMAKGASKALASYFVDQVGNAAKLQEAKQKVDEGVAMPDAATNQSFWQTRGEVYGALTQRDFIKKQLNPAYQMTGDNDALEAFNAFKKAYELAEKKFQKTDAMKGISENNLQPAMINMGADKYTAKEYEKAYRSFVGAIQAHDLLAENKLPSNLDDKSQYETYVYYAGVAATQGKMLKEALDILNLVYKTGNANADVYQIMYEAKVAMKDTAGAQAILEEGRKKHPDDTALLFAEINVYLAAGKLDELTSRLTEAIKKEPGNAGLYTTLGSVYDHLYQKALEEKNDVAAKNAFDEAMKNYEAALKIDPKNVDATYSTGALYYNKAAIVTKRMLEMPEDMSSAGLKKYEEMKAEMMGLFDQALPYFQKAESLNPNDVNTLIALKEIYTRKEDDLALEIKKRLDKVQAGEKNETSHFKN